MNKKNIFYLIIFITSLTIATNKTEESHTQIIAKQEKIIKDAYLKHKSMIKKKTPSLSTSQQLATELPEPVDFANQKLVEKFKTILPNSEHARLATKEIHTLINKNGLKSESELQEHKDLIHQKTLKTVNAIQTLHAKIQKKSKFYKKSVPVKKEAVSAHTVKKDKLSESALHEHKELMHQKNLKAVHETKIPHTKVKKKSDPYKTKDMQSKDKKDSEKR